MSKEMKERPAQAIKLSDKRKDLSMMLNKDGVRKLIEAVDSEGFGADRVISQIILEATDNPDILDCTHASILNAALTCLKWKLEPNSDLNLVYFIPYNNKNTGEKELSCQLSYIGMIKIAYRLNTITAIDAGVVYENDYFEYVQGTKRHLIYKQELKADRGNKIGCFVVIDLPNGNQIIEIANTKDIEDFKSASRNQMGGKTSPAWQRWEDQMIIKSTIKRALKKAPSIPELAEREPGNIYDGEANQITEALGLPSPKLETEKEKKSQADDVADMI